MKFSEVPAPGFSLRIRTKNGETIKGFQDAAAPAPEKNNDPKNKDDSRNEVYVMSVQSTPVRGEFELYTKDEVVTVVPVSSADINRLSSTLSFGHTILFQLTDPAPDGSAELHLLLFSGEQLEMGTLQIGIDETVQDALGSRKHADPLPVDKAARIMFSKSVLQHGGKTYFFIVAGEAAKTYLEADAAAEAEKAGEEKNAPAEQEVITAHDMESAGLEWDNEEEEDAGEAELPQPKVVYRNFAILGSDIRFALSERNMGNGKTIFLASRITRIKNRHEDPALRLACGNLSFVDWTETGERAMLARIQLDKLTETAGSYLRKWDEFGVVEGELFLERARQVGAIPFSIVEDGKNGIIKVQCGSLTQEQKTVLSLVTELDAVHFDGLPDYLEKPDMTFDEYTNRIVEDTEDEEFLGITRKKPPKKEEKNESITLQVEEFMPATGRLRLKTKDSTVMLQDMEFLIYSVAGEVAQINRRMKARRRIQTGRAANQNLGLLIEENGQIPPGRPQGRKIPALTSFVKQKVFPKNDPTDAQINAIEVALNTPDIALIQGPPGTGKTTVIAAIIERLNQETDKREGLRGHVLLTGFQHDAVTNMIERLTINGLPVPKFGNRSGAEENEDFAQFENRLLTWCRERTEALRAKNPRITESLEESLLRAMCIQYIKAPTLKQAIHLLEHASNLPSATISEDLRKRLNHELRLLESEQNGGQENESILRVIRGIRIRDAGFADDGPARAADVLYALQNELDEQDKALLVRASGWMRVDETPPFLNELRELKGKLLMRFTPAPMFRLEKTRDSVVNLIQETLSEVKRNGLRTRDKKTAALAELLMEMESNPEGMMENVKDYSFAFAATCQQSASWRMEEMKRTVQTADMGPMTAAYDYIIIDEAARVSPRDLMIPMVQGKRIILVGDHRQLPQLIDEKVALKMEEESEDESTNTLESEWLKKSMFEYLFTERIEKLEQADGIRRRVTLNKQFRTHPLLGDFISQNFYERFNPNEAFGSPLEEKHFAHNLSGTNGKCAVWLNVHDGEMSWPGGGHSAIRLSEVNAICSKLEKWIREDNDRTDNPKERLTFGVIAFYKAQSERIKEQLGSRFLDSVGEKRLRIGTVDAFQGMEFDVVFLSVVRTRTKDFGFLKLYNRLNVSMSRQKRLLVVVGDADFYSTPEAKENVPGLANFLTLCRNKGVVEDI